MWFYPAWFLREHGADIEQSYRDLLTHGDPQGRSRARMFVWLARDAVGAGLRARLLRRPQWKRAYRINDDEGDGMATKMMTKLRHATRSLMRSVAVYGRLSRRFRTSTAYLLSCSIAKNNP